MASCATDPYHYPARDAQRAIANLVSDRRQAFAIGVDSALGRVRVFAQACSDALGTISRDEALDAIEREVIAELRRLR